MKRLFVVLALFAACLPADPVFAATKKPASGDEVKVASGETKKPASAETKKPASADAWATYLKAMGGYYRLDAQGPVHVSCHLTVPWLEEMLGKVNEARGGSGWGRALSGFTVNFNSGSEPSFSTPRLNLAMSADRQFDATMREAIGLVITNVKESVTMMLESLTAPKREKFNGMTAASGADGITRFDYVDDKGDRVQEFHMGNLEIDKGVTKNGEAFEAKVEFKPLREKMETKSHRGGLAATSVQVKVTKAPGTISIFDGAGDKKTNDEPVEVTMKLTVEYQDLGKIFIPSRIIHTMEAANNREHPDPPVEVDLTDCSGGN
jgi:hypothetical protein